jgi:hypothetical protein
MKYAFLVLGMNESRIRHLVKHVDVVVLIRLSLTVCRSLALECGPMRTEQDKQVGNTLKVLRIVLEDHASRKEVAKLVNQLPLEAVLFESAHLVPIKRRKEVNEADISRSFH